jgi:hypothetical protein
MEDIVTNGIYDYVTFVNREVNTTSSYGLVVMAIHIYGLVLQRQLIM